MMQTSRVLVTCPPMLVSIEDFRSQFVRRGAELITPRVVQTMSVEALTELVPHVDGWIAGDDPVNAAVLQAGRAGRLRAVVKWGVGVDNVDFAAAQRLNMPLVNTPGMFGAEVADLAMSYVAALARDTFRIDRGVRGGEWPKPCGISLASRLVAVVGLGDVGQALTRRLLAADMRVIGYDANSNAARDLSSVTRAAWPDRLEEADFVVLACALTSSNRHMVDAATLSRLKPGVRIVNVARGALIDETALAQSLASGHVHSAALDVFETEPLPHDSPLRGFEQCIFGSHNASNTMHAVRRTSERAMELLFTMLSGPQ